jgi:methylenetetrahydrofolate dehydrogenase (NAD+)
VRPSPRLPCRPRVPCPARPGPRRAPALRDPGRRAANQWTGKACESDGIKFELREVDRMDLEVRAAAARAPALAAARSRALTRGGGGQEALTAANRDPNVHGIMIYYPCFGNAPSFYGGNMDDYLRDSVPIEKDVEGLCHTYRRNLYHNVRHIDAHTQENQGGILVPSATANTKKCLLPCTPLAIIKILEFLQAYDQNLPVGERLRGKTISVINRSEIVGRPLAAMMVPPPPLVLRGHAASLTPY